MTVGVVQDRRDLTGPALVAGLAVVTAAVMHAVPTVAWAVPAAVAGSAFVAHRRWLALTAVVFGGLVLLSYGFNNVPFPVGPVRMPAVAIAIPVLAIMSFPVWRPALSEQGSRRIAVVATAVVAMTFLRLLVDVPRFGVVAVRDALFAVDLLALPLGYAVVRAKGTAAASRGVQRVLVVAVAWFCLFPFAEQIAALGPDVGVQRPTPLLAMTSAGVIACVALMWWAVARPRGLSLVPVLAVLVVLLTQTRGLYLALPLAFVVATWASRRLRPSGRAGPAASPILRGVAAIVVGFAALAVLPPLPGRLATARPGFVLEQLGTLTGHEGPGSGSLKAREEWWPIVLHRVESTTLGPVVGVGFGPDLIGFRGRNGAEVRKPHNDFLEMFARVGAVGLGLWLLLIAVVVHQLVRRVRAGSTLAGWALACQPVFLVTALTQPLFAFAYGGAVFWFVAGLGLSEELYFDEAAG